jgi:hypothetical protein
MNLLVDLGIESYSEENNIYDLLGVYFSTRRSSKGDGVP